MRRFGNKYLAFFCTAMVAITGCSGQSQAPATESSVAESVEESTKEKESADEAESAEETEKSNSKSNVSTPAFINEELYKEVISELSSDEYYTFANVGLSNDLLIVAEKDYVFYDLSNQISATKCDIYCINQDSDVVNLGKLESSGTASPLAVYNDAIYGATHSGVISAKVNEDMTGLDIDEDASFDDYGKATVLSFESAGGEAESDEASADIVELPEYEYPDTASVYHEVFRYLLEYSQDMISGGSVTIPYAVEIAKDESDEDDIRIYGDFWVYSYDLDGDTLVSVSGGDFPGVMHIKKSDGRYQVTSFDAVEEGEAMNSSAQELFGDYYDKLMEVMGDGQASENDRTAIISEYVIYNGLPITQYQDYGWDPVELSGDGEDYGPSDFVQEQSGKTEFDDYDDVIANLREGQGYAKITLYGSDLELLAVTDTVFEAEKSAAQASIYADSGSRAYMLSVVTGNGSAYPLRYEDGILYGGDNHEYTSYFVYENDGTVSLMIKDDVSDGDATGEYTGFLREDNNYDNDKEFTGGKEEFEEMIKERDSKPILEFTVVE